MVECFRKLLVCIAKEKETGNNHHLRSLFTKNNLYCISLQSTWSKRTIFKIKLSCKKIVLLERLILQFLTYHAPNCDKNSCRYSLHGPLSRGINVLWRKSRFRCEWEKGSSLSLSLWTTHHNPFLEGHVNIFLILTIQKLFLTRRFPIVSYGLIPAGAKLVHFGLWEEIARLIIL